MNRVGTYFGIANFVPLILLILVLGCKTQLPDSSGDGESYQKSAMLEVSTSGEYDILQDSSLNTVTQELKETDDLIISVDWEHRQSEIDIHRIRFEIDHVADSVSYAITACDQEWEYEVKCSDTAHFVITATKGQFIQTYRDSINLQLINQLFVLDRSNE